jgi:hypothetical protein
MKMAATTVPPLALTLKAIIIFDVGGVDAHTKLILEREEGCSIKSKRGVIHGSRSERVSTGWSSYGEPFGANYVLYL